MSMWIGYAKSGKEFDVMEAIQDLSIEAWVARKVEVIRSGKDRWPRAITSPLLPNYVFITCNEAQWHQLASVKHLAPTKMLIPRVTGLLTDFFNRADAEYSDRTARIAAGERLEQFSEGEALEIISGPLAGQMATFRRIVESITDPFPKIRGEVSMMGQTVTADIDPLDVRRAV